jgi:hypothetical protein
MQDSVVIIALEYLEPDFAQTIKCLEKFNVPIIWAKRDGVGNISRAFNEAFLYKLKGNANYLTLPRYIWFTTNILCDEFLLPNLVKAMDSTGFAAIHPSFISIHRHLRPDGSGTVKEARFIEFTAPIFRSEVFEKFYLDEDLWYWFMDLDISYRMKKNGYKVGVHHGASLIHSYLDDNKSHPVSDIRHQLRKIMNKHGEDKMMAKYGRKWLKKVGVY